MFARLLSEALNISSSLGVSEGSFISPRSVGYTTRAVLLVLSRSELNMSVLAGSPRQ